MFPYFDPNLKKFSYQFQVRSARTSDSNGANSFRSIHISLVHFSIQFATKRLVHLQVNFNFSFSLSLSPNNIYSQFSQFQFQIRFVKKPYSHVGYFDPAEILNRRELKDHMTISMVKLGEHLIFFFIYLYR